MRLFIVYLECVLRKTESDKEDASSYAYQQHEAFRIDYVRCAYNDTLSSLYHFLMKTIAWFARQFNDLAHRVNAIVSTNVPMEALSHLRGTEHGSAIITISSRKISDILLQVAIVDNAAHRTPSREVYPHACRLIARWTER